MKTETLHGCLSRFPGAALELSAAGVVRASNGRLDQLVGKGLTGLAFADLLDSTSQAKWRQILSDAERANPACTWELVVTTPSSLELRTFLAVWGGSQSDDVLWLLEYSGDSRLEMLYTELAELHRELVDAQRTLGRERNRLARALEKAEAAVRTRDNVLAIVSHDLRNPVNTMMMTAGLLRLPISEDKKAEQIEILERTAARMGRLIDDLLDLSALESGRFRVDMNSVSLNPLIEEGYRMLEPQAERKHQRIVTRLAPELPEVRGDRHRLLQVLSNLLGNAIKFTPERGAITVCAEAQDASSRSGIPDPESPTTTCPTSSTGSGTPAENSAAAPGSASPSQRASWKRTADASGPGARQARALPSPSRYPLRTRRTPIPDRLRRRRTTGAGRRGRGPWARGATLLPRIARTVPPPRMRTSGVGAR
jgi:signal transduction histidine kinase